MGEATSSTFFSEILFIVQSYPIIEGCVHLFDAAQPPLKKKIYKITLENNDEHYRGNRHTVRSV
jgi:hypothetical protein